MTAEEIAKYIQDEKVRQQVLEALKNEYLPKADFTKATQAKADELKALQEKLAAQEAENKRYMEWYYTKYEPWAAQVKADMADSTEATQAEAEELKQLQEKLAAQEAANRLYLEWYYTKYEPWAAQVKADAERRAA